MHLFLIIWSCIVGAAAIGTLVLSAVTYRRVRCAPVHTDNAAVGQSLE